MNQLDVDLTEAARAYDLPPGDLTAVVDRGRRRARRRRAAISTVAAVAVLAASVSTMRVVGRDPGTPVATRGGSVRTGAGGWDWERVDPRSALGQAAGMTGHGPLYALSTAPGEVDVNGGSRNRVLWRSDDGVEWQAVSRLGTDLYLADLSSTDDRIYAVGTAPPSATVPGRRPASPVLAGWSDDGGKTWQRTELPVDIAAIAAKSTWSGVTGSEVAAGPGGTVAVVLLGAELDVPAVLPPGATAPNGWAITPTGVDVLGPRPAQPCPSGTSAPKEDGPQPRASRVHAVWCVNPDGTPAPVPPQQAHGVVASYTWDQLKVDGDLLRAVLRQPVAFRAERGSTRFERTDLPVAGGVAGVAVQGGGDRFELLLSSVEGDDTGKTPRFGLTVLTSRDGRAWAAEDGAHQGLAWVSASGSLGGRSVFVGDGPSGPVLLSSARTGTWTATKLADLVALPPGTTASLAGAAVGAAGVVAVVAVLADERQRRTEREDRWTPEFRLLTSADGTSWHESRLDEVIGAPAGGVSQMVAAGDQVVVTALLHDTRSREGKPPARVTVVGRPR